VELARAVQQDVWTEALPGQARSDEVGILARALAAHDQEMKRFLTREQLFTGDVSHELRTPLTVMLGAAEVLTARLEGQAELLPVAERIRRTAQETANRVAALLLLSRAPDELERPLVALGPLLEQELERCRPLVEGKPVRLELRIEHPALAHGRPELMAIAFGNLIRNACQSTEAGHVRVTLQRQQVLVEDSGCGVAEEVRHQLFHRLVRAGDRVPGTGLGLAIVQRVCEHLGWTVSLNESGAGVTSFAVRTHAGSV
jgi:signal transduction histidine kinase